MGAINHLVELARLAATGVPADEALRRAIPHIQAGLGANGIFFVYGDSGGFRTLGTEPGPDLGDIALWLIHRDLTARRGPAAFDLEDGHVENFRNASQRRHCEHIAALLPIPNATSEMLIAAGSWPGGPGTARLRFLEAALPSLAMLLERRLDSARAERQRHQISALANITRVLSASEDLESVLTGIAGTIASVTEADYVSIDLVDTSGNVTMRRVNSARPGTEELQERWQRGASRPDPVRDAVISTRAPQVFPDAQNDARIPEGGRNFFIRTLIRSTGVFPLLTKDEVLGVLSVASHRPLGFSADEVEILEGLAAQVATAVKGIQLYRELAQSREELRRVNSQLQESMGIEHHLARTDPLTGIPNRRFIDETVETEVARAVRYHLSLSVVMADLDDLKGINDGFGHAAGDDVLRHVATLARATCRNIDVVGRYGGDEFVFVLPATSREEAVAFAERFRRQLADSRASSRSAGPLAVTASLGVAQWDTTCMEGSGCIVRQADRAMYAAKTAGRNRTMVAIGEAARAA
jgi:diguanylate cyclase (GGDEF)-like protein